MEHKIGGRLHNPLRISAVSLDDDDTDDESSIFSASVSLLCVSMEVFFDYLAFEYKLANLRLHWCGIYD